MFSTQIVIVQCTIGRWFSLQRVDDSVNKGLMVQYTKGWFSIQWFNGSVYKVVWFIFQRVNCFAYKGLMVQYTKCYGSAYKGVMVQHTKG